MSCYHNKLDFILDYVKSQRRLVTLSGETLLSESVSSRKKIEKGYLEHQVVFTDEPKSTPTICSSTPVIDLSSVQITLTHSDSSTTPSLQLKKKRRERKIKKRKEKKYCQEIWPTTLGDRARVSLKSGKKERLGFFGKGKVSTRLAGVGDLCFPSVPLPPCPIIESSSERKEIIETMELNNISQKEVTCNHFQDMGTQTSPRPTKNEINQDLNEIGDENLGFTKLESENSKTEFKSTNGIHSDIIVSAQNYEKDQAHTIEPTVISVQECSMEENSCRSRIDFSEYDSEHCSRWIDGFNETLVDIQNIPSSSIFHLDGGHLPYWSYCNDGDNDILDPFEAENKFWRPRKLI